MSPAPHPSQGERSIGELFKELANETSALVRQEVKLATTEMTQKASFAARQSAFIAAGGLLATIALLSLIAAFILGLGTLIPLWVSALLVGAVIAVAAFIVINKGVTALKSMSPAPQQTILSLEENKAWVRQQIR